MKSPAIASTVVVLCGLLTLALSGANAAGPIDKPNMVLILVDDLDERCLSGFGGTIPTPNLDRLAQEGLVFDNAHAAPMCAPTRYEMFTSLSRAGRGRPDASIPFLTNDLQRLGYTTGMAGKWFVGSVFDPPLRGFDESLIMVNGYRHWAPDVMAFGSRGLMKELNQPKVTGRLNEWEIPREGDGLHRATRLSGRHADDVCVEFLRDYFGHHKDGPFFAYYSTKLVHVPQAPTPDADEDTIEVYQKAFEQANDRDLTGVDAYARAEAARRNIEIDSKRFCAQAPLLPYNQMLQFMWKNWQPLGGGIIADRGAHAIDQVNWAMGWDEIGPVEIWSTTEAPKYWNRGVRMRYADGTEVRFESSDGPDFGAIFIGEEGKVEINRNKFSSNPVDLIPEATLEENEVPDHFRNWLDCIKTQATPNAPVEVGHRAASVAHLINVCREVGRRLRWDCQAEKFVGDDEANRVLVKPRRRGFELPGEGNRREAVN